MLRYDLPSSKLRVHNYLVCILVTPFKSLFFFFHHRWVDYFSRENRPDLKSRGHLYLTCKFQFRFLSSSEKRIFRQITYTYFFSVRGALHHCIITVPIYSRNLFWTRHQCWRNRERTKFCNKQVFRKNLKLSFQLTLVCEFHLSTSL